MKVYTIMLFFFGAVLARPTGYMGDSAGKQFDDVVFFVVGEHVLMCCRGRDGGIRRGAYSSFGV